MFFLTTVPANSMHVELTNNDARGVMTNKGAAYRTARRGVEAAILNGGEDPVGQRNVWLALEAHDLPDAFRNRCRPLETRTCV